jgi:hypothetical protein
METAEQLEKDEKQKTKLLKASKIFFVITLLYSCWIAILILGTYFLQLGINWAGLTIEQWILSAIILISVILAIEIFLLLQYSIPKMKRQRPEKPKQKEYIQGKRVFRYTIPINAQGGIFSKTYILIDEKRVLNLRYQMIPPGDLWGQKQEP